MSARLTIGTERDSSGDGHAGVLRRGREVLVRCGHSHTNRDQSTQPNGVSARDCINTLVRSARHPEAADWHRSGIRESAARMARVHAATKRQADAWQDRTDAAIEKFDASLPGVRELIGEEPVFGANDQVVLTPPAPELPCPACGVTLLPDRWLPKLAGAPWQGWRPATTSIFTAPPACANGSYRHAEPAVPTEHHTSDATSAP